MTSSIYVRASIFWRRATEEQKKHLLHEMRLDESWATCKTLDEVRQRGGGWVVRDFVKLVQLREGAQTK
jgi:hypothetical protein